MLVHRNGWMVYKIPSRCILREMSCKAHWDLAAGPSQPVACDSISAFSSSDVQNEANTLPVQVDVPDPIPLDPARDVPLSALGTSWIVAAGPSQPGASDFRGDALTRHICNAPFGQQGRSFVLFAQPTQAGSYQQVCLRLRGRRCQVRCRNHDGASSWYAQ